MQKLHLRQACLWKKLEDSPTEAFPETGSVAITSQLGGISSGILHGWMRRVRQLIWALVFLCFKGVIGFVIHSESFICKNVTWTMGLVGVKIDFYTDFLLNLIPRKESSMTEGLKRRSMRSSLVSGIVSPRNFPSYVLNNIPSRLQPH